VIPALGNKLRLIRLARAEDARRDAWIKALRRIDPSHLRPLKEDAATGVYRLRLLGREVVLKYWVIPGTWGHIKALARFSRGHRHWRGARWLVTHGFRTAEPLALARGRDSDGNSIECLVMEALAGKTLLRHMAERRLSPRAEHRLAESLGRDAARMQSLGRFNRDHKPSNLIIADPQGPAEIAVIDCVAIQRTRRGPLSGGERMLLSLAIEPVGTDCPPRRTLAARTIWSYVDAISGGAGAPNRHQRRAMPDRHTRVLSIWRRLQSALAANADPRPRVIPLHDAGNGHKPAGT
jgi:tRNA A-37 threonylcarbamoyl transferase component Bud32